MTPKHTLRKKIHYWFDNLMGRGAPAMLLLLAGLSGLIIFVGTIALILFKVSATEGTDTVGMLEAFWMSLMRAMDAGAMGADNGWGFRVVSLLVTLGGIFVLSALIGVINSGIEAKLDSLREGRSAVLESGHTLILGWSDKIFTILSELAIANANQPKTRIVVLALMDKVSMETAIREAVHFWGKTKIICRSGRPDKISDLDLVNHQGAKSIVILGPDDSDSDSMAIKTILALTNHPNRRPSPYHILAEIRDPKNVEIARLIGKDEVETILSDEIIGKIIIQTSRQSGLSVVYQELFDFSGDEIYFAEVKEAQGLTYGEALFMFEDSAVMGIYKSESGRVLLNPLSGLCIEAGDQLIAIASDDDAIVPSRMNPGKITKTAISHAEPPSPQPENTLILGWNKRAEILLREINNYVQPESHLQIVSLYELDEAFIETANETYPNLHIRFLQADTTSRKVIEALNVFDYDHIQVLCYRENLDIQEADAKTLVTLLHLRALSEEKGTHLRVVSEMLDIQNKELAEVTKADDFIVSDKLISLLIGQVSENKGLMRVFEELLTEEGCEITLKPYEGYLTENASVNFYTVLESALQKGQTAIGYRLAHLADSHAHAYGVVLNPSKSALIQFAPGDKIILLSED